MSNDRPVPPADPVSPPGDRRDGPTVVGIGASAGGLEACRRLLASLPPGHGMALVLVQHLDPTHESLMADLLADHTSMTVAQARDGERLRSDHLHLIPPGAFLAVDDGVLRLSRPQARHGARLPFDYFLASLARSCGPRAVAVVLSGSGADGSGGLPAIKAAGGFVVVQDPDEAGFDGMPRNAIATGTVDAVLPVDEIGPALVAHLRGARDPASAGPDPAASADRLAEIVDLLRARTPHDFRLYKPGTLRRRIERRVAAVGAADADAYLERLRGDPHELEILAADLLINVTGFFRDADVFDHLATTIVPDLVRDRSPDRPIRIWVPGCSTGEEAYSLAMVFFEAITAAKRNLKLQVFASDVDADAVATAREGLYPATIEADVSAERLARFFIKEEHGWRVTPDLRGVVVFTVQDVLTDPPFSRLDLVSCRNLLIYLGSEAQEKVLALFHFALREGGLLLLGNSETAGDVDGRFEALSKPGRLFRRIGPGRAGDFGPVSGGDGLATAFRRHPGRLPKRQSTLAELCRRLVIEDFAPAAVLIDRKYECLYTLGPIDRHLRVAPGAPSHDLLTQVPEALRIKLRSAIQRAVQDDVRVIVDGGRIARDGIEVPFSIDVRPVHEPGEEPMFLVCFVEERPQSPRGDLPVDADDDPRIVELERELDATRRELQGAIRSLEVSVEEQKVVNEEALSANEEFQSTNEELLTSKEELQSLNEELTALNGQLQETLERHRTTSNDLQNVLYSTDVATLFLDTDLNIRFFTPATRSLFSIIASDVGRPLADLRFLAADATLLDDARGVMRSWTPIEREIEAPGGLWFIRRVLPYRTLDDGMAGVVITFVDVTERRRISEALAVAKREAERASLAKSRFLAAANHDLRQPLQTLCLLQDLLAGAVESDKAKRLVARFEDALGAMTGMLDTLLDMNQIEAGTVQVELADVPIGEVFERMAGEFGYPAVAKGLVLRVCPSTQVVRTDRRLLEQMIRNLLANALKYTPKGRVLLGCRRHGATLRIEVWDTGIGIAAEDLQSIFEEYHQIDNAACDRSRGLGLGLSIVQRLADLLGHRVHVRSRPGLGSVFSIELPRTIGPREPASSVTVAAAAPEPTPVGGRRIGSILVIEDEPDVRDLLELVLEREGHLVVAAPDGVTAVKSVVEGTLRPDLVLADFNLPGGLDGLGVVARLREESRRPLPAIILTGDISPDTLRDIVEQDCLHLDKPVKTEALIAAVDGLLAAPAHRPVAKPRPDTAAPSPATPMTQVWLVDDDAHFRSEMGALLAAEGLTAAAFDSGEAFLAAYRPGGEACLLIDAYLPGMSGLDLLHRLAAEGHALPSIMITGHGDVAMAVEAMKAGAVDFLAKPVDRDELMAGVRRALAHARDDELEAATREEAMHRLAGLTPRQTEILEKVLAGHPSKNIATDLGISQRTVENHRAAIMRKTGAKSLPALARLVAAAAG